MNEMARFKCIECGESRFCSVGWCQRDVCGECLTTHFKRCTFCQSGTFATVPARSHSKVAS